MASSADASSSICLTRRSSLCSKTSLCKAQSSTTLTSAHWLLAAWLPASQHRPLRQWSRACWLAWRINQGMGSVAASASTQQACPRCLNNVSIVMPASLIGSRVGMQRNDVGVASSMVVGAQKPVVNRQEGDDMIAQQAWSIGSWAGRMRRRNGVASMLRKDARRLQVLLHTYTWWPRPNPKPPRTRSALAARQLGRPACG